MLTRETKAGVVIASSFLVLVGVVLLAKLRGDPQSVDEQAQTNSPALVAPETPAESPKPVPAQTDLQLQPTPGPDTPRIQLTQARTDTTPPKATEEPKSTDPLPQPAPTPLVPLDIEPKKEPDKPAPSPPPAPVSPLPLEGPPKVEPVMTPKVEPPPREPVVEPAAPMPVRTPPKPEPPLAPLTPPDVAPPKPASTPVIEDRSPIVPPVPPPALGGSDSGTRTIPLPDSETRTIPPPGNDPLPKPMPPEVEKPQPMREPSLEPLPALPPTEIHPTKPLPPVNDPVPAPRETPVKPSLPRAVDNVPAQPVPMPEARPTLEPSVRVPATPTARPRPAVVPEVDSWDEEVHAWRAGDSFPAICKRYYNDEVYATALLEFNRARPQGPEGLQESPPVVRPGQNVFIPPIRILEKEHAAAIPSSPTTVPKPVASSTAVPGERSYRVGKTGEMFLDIAKRTGARWEDIYLLNQKYDPKLPVPPGTVLRLPAGAEQRP